MRIHKLAAAALSALLTTALVVGMLPLSAAAASSAEIQKDIDALKAKNKEIQKQIDGVQSQYNANMDDMKSIVAQKSAVDQEIALLSNKIAATNEQIVAYGQLIADTQDALDAANEDLRTLSEDGKLTYWQVIFQANSFTDLLDRIDMVQEINASDRRRIEQMRIAADIVTANQMSLATEKGELEAVREQLASDEAALQEKRTESDDVLRELEAKSEEFELLMEESEALQDELMQEIAGKEKELKEAKYDEYLAKLALQGDNPPSNATWVTPVSGWTLTSPFGMRTHPILKITRMHNGIDMSCAQGTPIYATRAGKVTAASYQAGGAGNYVSINHLDGFSSIYMHLSSYCVSAGQIVSAGELIGLTGATGITTGDHLHFGISYNGVYVNPCNYVALY